MSDREEIARLLANFEDRQRKANRAARLERSSVMVSDDGTRSIGVRQTLASVRNAALEGALALLPYITAANISLYFTPAAPDPVAGHLWLSPETVLYGVSAGGWEPLTDQSGVVALAGLREALVTDDGRIEVWKQITPPATAAFGDLWFTTDGTPSRWENGSAWVPLIPSQTQSFTYVPGEEGWGFQPDGDAQVKDLTVLGSLAAPQGISTDMITLSGTDLTETLGLSSIGKIISARLPQQAADLAMSTTQTKLFELNCGIVPGGRTYRASVTCQIRNTAAVGTTDRLKFKFVHTTDGSTPILTSPAMDGGFNDNSCTPSGNWAVYRFEAEIDIATTCPLKIGFTADVITGAGSYVMYALSSTPSRPIFALYDDGPLGARQDSAISVTGDSTSRYVKTFSATWAYGADAANGAEMINSWSSIGGFDDMCGYVGFDSAAMVAALTGAIAPVSLIARWRPRTRVSSGGLDVRLGTHNFSSSAAASAAAGGWTSFAHANLAVMGITLLSNIRNNTVPATSYDESLGTTVFNQFKAGTRKGLVWLGEPAEAVGGEGSVYLDGTYQVQLIFTYDGTS